MRAVKRAGGQVDVGVLNGLDGFIDADLPRCQGLGIKLHPDGVLLLAKDLHLRHAADHRDALCHHCVGVFACGVKRQRVGPDRHVNDRLIGGVHLAKRRRRRHPWRKLPLRLGNHGLNILGRCIDVPAEVKLKADLRASLRIRG